MAPPRGRFIWHELLTSDPDAIAPFYTRVVKWKVSTWEQNPSYRLLSTGGPPMAGLMELPEEARAMGAPPHWLTYVAVPDVDATVRQAVGLGAKTYVAGMDIPTVGRMAVLADPQGATFAVYTPSMPGDGSDDAEVGDFSWHELVTTDYRKAWDFYRALFGWEHAESFDMGPTGTYWMFRRGGGTRTLGGMFDKPPEMDAPPHWLPYVKVPSADGTVALAKRNGGRVVNGPMEVPGGDRIAQIMDPLGAVFAVHSLAAVQAPAKKKTKRAPRKKPARKSPAMKKVAVRRARKRRAAKRAASGTVGARARKVAGRAVGRARKAAGKAARRAAGKAGKVVRKAAKKAAGTARKAARKAARATRTAAGRAARRAGKAARTAARKARPRARKAARNIARRARTTVRRIGKAK